MERGSFNPECIHDVRELVSEFEPLTDSFLLSVTTPNCIRGYPIPVLLFVFFVVENELWLLGE